MKQTVKEVPALNWLIKVLRFSVNPRDKQTGEEVLQNPDFGEKLTRKKIRELLEEGKGSNFLYEKMKRFQDWSRGQTELPKSRRIFEYFGLGQARRSFQKAGGSLNISALDRPLDFLWPVMRRGKPRF